MIAKTALGLLALAILATPVAASPTHDSAVAMRSVEAASRVAPGDGGATIELASAYWRAGRTAEASNAFRRALTLDNVMLETRTGDAIWSHEVARRVLARDVALTSR